MQLDEIETASRDLFANKLTDTFNVSLIVLAGILTFLLSCMFEESEAVQTQSLLLWSCLAVICAVVTTVLMRFGSQFFKTVASDE